MMTIEDILIGHQYLAEDTYCSCGTPGLWTWKYWVAHVTPILQEQQDESVSNMPPSFRLRIKRAQEQIDQSIREILK